LDVSVGDRNFLSRGLDLRRRFQTDRCVSAFLQWILEAFPKQ